jgi:hypothetical protein
MRCLECQLEGRWPGPFPEFDERGVELPGPGQSERRYDTLFLTLDIHHFFSPLNYPLIRAHFEQRVMGLTCCM